MATTTDHSGHRERLRTRIREYGLASLAPHEVLEYLLFPFVPRRNTNDIAHALLDAFGDLPGVLEADSRALASVVGMTQNAALFLANLLTINSLYTLEKNKAASGFDDPAKAVRYLCHRIGHMPYENFAALCLDAKGKLLHVVQFESQNANYVQINVRNLLKQLVCTRAVNVIVAHNHPSGDVTPSDEDRALFLYLKEVLSHVEITLLDCLIVAGTRSFSFVAEEEFRARLHVEAPIAAEAKPRPRKRTPPRADADEMDLLHAPHDDET